MATTPPITWILIREPQPVVLLLACGSAAVELQTLNDLFTALVRAGAAAVIGAETLTFTRLVSPFAREIALALWGKDPLGKDAKTLGEAMRLARRRLLVDGNPLGLVFTAFGDADLKLSPST